MGARTEIDDQTAQFLLAEYAEAWAHIREIDSRRFKLLEFYISLNAILVAAGAVLVARQASAASHFNMWSIAAAAVVAVASAIVICAVLYSERAANIRFRKRVNYIRGTFLCGLKDPRTIGYLADSAGYNTQTERQNDELRGIGKTLTGIYAFFATWTAIWVAGAVVALVINAGIK